MTDNFSFDTSFGNNVSNDTINVTSSLKNTVLGGFAYKSLTIALTSSLVILFSIIVSLVLNYFYIGKISNGVRNLSDNIKSNINTVSATIDYNVEAAERIIDDGIDGVYGVVRGISKTVKDSAGGLTGLRDIVVGIGGVVSGVISVGNDIIGAVCKACNVVVSILTLGFKKTCH